MPHDIVDNRTVKLLDTIQEILPTTERAKFAVGYFFLSGLEAVEAQIANLRELRLLIGSTTNRQTIEQIAEGYRRLAEVKDAAEAMVYPKHTQIAHTVAQTSASVGGALAVMDAALDFQEALFDAQSWRGPARLEHLRAADAHLNKLRLYLRLVHHWRWINDGQYRHVSVMVAEVGRLLGGWIKQTSGG